MEIAWKLKIDRLKIPLEYILKVFNKYYIYVFKYLLEISSFMWNRIFIYWKITKLNIFLIAYDLLCQSYE